MKLLLIIFMSNLLRRPT